MSEPNLALSLFLDGDSSFQLNRKGLAGSTPTLMIQMHDTSSAATIMIPGYQSPMRGFSLSFALQGGLFDLFDVESNSKIFIPPNNAQPGELVVRAGAPMQQFCLRIDPSEGFWTQLLRPGHQYEVRWTNGERVPQAYREEAGQDPPQRVPVRLLPRPIRLNVSDDATNLPQLSLSLTPTAQTCHLSGEPRFGFRLEVTSHADQVITVCLHKTPLKELHGMEDIAKVEDEEGEEVEWPWGIGCWEGPEPFPSDDSFEEFEPSVRYERIFWLEKYNEATSNGGELEALKAGMAYKGKLGGDLRGAFSRWRKGNKRELLAGDEKEKEERWKSSSGQIILEVSDSFTFDTAP